MAGKREKKPEGPERESKTKAEARAAIAEREVCPSCGSTVLLRDYQQGTLVCGKCGLIVQDRIMDSGPEWRAFDQEQREQRGRVGAPMTYSVDYKEPIVLLRNDRMWVSEIGKFVDGVMASAETRREGNLEIAEVDGYSTLAVDENYKVVFRPITHVTRHKVEELHEVLLETNRKILVTDRHCLYTVKGGEIVPIEVKDLKEGDFIAAPKSVPAPPSIATEIHLLEELSTLPEEEIRSVEIEFNGGSRIPLPEARETDIGDLTDAKVLLKGGTRSLPCELPIDERIAKLLGYYTSKGRISKGQDVVFSFDAREVEPVEEVCGILRSLGFNPELAQLDCVTQVRISDELLALLIKALGAGGGARERRVPPIVFSMPNDAKLAFLHACARGNGCTHEEKKPGWEPLAHVHGASANSELSNGLILLRLQLGTETRREGTIEGLPIAPEKCAQPWKCGEGIRTDGSLARHAAERFDDRKLPKLAKSDLAFLRVKSVRRVKPSTGYAYDLTVAGCKNFIAGRGWILAFDTIHDKGLSTMIDWRNKDSHGKDLTPRRRAQIYRLRKWQRRIRVSDAMERNLAFALSELDRMASHLGLPRNVRETAAVIYRRAVEKHLIRGRSIEGVAAAALYAACRENKVPRTLDEIADVSRVSKKEIGRSYRFIARELLMHLRPTSPVDYVARFGSELGLSGEVQSRAIELLRKASEKGLTSGRGPTGVAAAAIYIASALCGERRTQRDVADVARVTEVTVRNRYKELCEKLGLDVEL